MSACPSVVLMETSGGLHEPHFYPFDSINKSLNLQVWKIPIIDKIL